MARTAHSRRSTPTSTMTPPSRLARARADAVPAVVPDVLGGAGRPLDRETRASMEPRFGRDFSQVRIHDDAHAGESARAIGACAYTAGSSIVLDSQRHPLHSDEGRGVLAHELTHVAQQRYPTPAATGGLSIQEEPAREAEARQGAAAIAHGRTPPAAAQRVADAGAVQRLASEPDAASLTGSPGGGGGAGATATRPCIEDVVGEDPTTLTEAGTVTIVEFSSPGCEPCKVLRASLEQMCQTFAQAPPKAPVRIFSIDIVEEGNEEIASRYTNGSVPWIYFYVGSQKKDAFNTALQPDVLDTLVAEYTEEASQSGAWKGFKSGAKWGGLIGGGLGVLGAIAVGASDLEGNAKMLGMLGAVAGGALAGAALAGGVGALVGWAREEKKGSRRKKKKKPSPKRRDGIVNEPDELEADAMAADVLRGPGAAHWPPAAADASATRGAPMDTALRLDMESRFGRDFGQVRLHRDAAANRVADSMQAYAVTEGSDIYFARDGYAPHTAPGRAILAHELTHVAQQDVSGPSSANASLEIEARHASASVARGIPANVQHGAPEGTQLALTRAEKTLLWAAGGLAVGAAAGALIGLGAAKIAGSSLGEGAKIGALIGGGAGLIGGGLLGFLLRRTDRVGAQEADALIRRRYGKYLPGGVPAPLRNALIRPVSSADLCERVRCRRPEASCNLIGWTDTGVPWRGASPPAETITSPEDEPVCNGKRMEHATPERPVIYFQRDTPDAGILVHEGLHALSHPEFQRLHNIVNEGTTELYTRRLLDDVNIAVHGSGYDTEVRQVEKFERLVGEEPLARAYFGGDLPGLDRAATAIFGPCSLEKWAFELQMNFGESRAADAVLAGRNINYCSEASSLGSAATAPPGEGSEGGHHAGGASAAAGGPA